MPCPSDVDVLRTNSNYGWATGSNTGNCSQATTLQDSADNDVVMGMFPYKSMVPRLDPSTVIDGWGNRFSYIVNEDFTLKSNYETALYTETRIEIANFDDNDTLNADAAFVLISHGPNAHGAYVGKSPASGTTVRQITISSPSSNDTENSWVSGAGGDAAVFVQAMPQSGYDDILLYKPKWRLPEPIN